MKEYGNFTTREIAEIEVLEARYMGFVAFLDRDASEDNYYSWFCHVVK